MTFGRADGTALYFSLVCVSTSVLSPYHLLCLMLVNGDDKSYHEFICQRMKIP